MLPKATVSSLCHLVLRLLLLLVFGYISIQIWREKAYLCRRCSQIEIELCQGDRGGCLVVMILSIYLNLSMLSHIHAPAFQPLDG